MEYLLPPPPHPLTHQSCECLRQIMAFSSQAGNMRLPIVEHMHSKWVELSTV